MLALKARIVFKSSTTIIFRRIASIKIQVIGGGLTRRCLDLRRSAVKIVIQLIMRCVATQKRSAPSRTTLTAMPKENSVSLGLKNALFSLLRLGDDRFSELLAREDRGTRETVGAMIDCQVDWTRHQFPKTRRLYSYRYISPSHQAFEKKHGRRLSSLIAAVAAEPRFSKVRFYNRGEGTTTILIVAPGTLPITDREDLRRLIRRYVGNDAVLTFAD